MANKMRRFFAWILVLTMITGQLAIPAAAEEAAESASVDVVVDVTPVPEAPAAESQAPAASPSVTVSTSEPVTGTVQDPANNVTEESTSTTTSWTGSEGNTSTSGSETTTTVTGTSNSTGQTLYEGGNTSGSETTITTETSTSTETEEDFVTKEVITNTESTTTESGSSEVTGPETSSTTSGEWNNTEDGYTEGDFVAGKTEQHKQESESSALGSEEIPEGGILIDLTPGKNGSHTGTVNGEVIPLEEGMTIPQGATLVKDADGNVIGYTYSTTTETITGTQIQEGSAQLDASNSSTDTTGTTSFATPDLEAAGVYIDSKTQITEETDDSGNVTAYVVTNTKEETYETDATGQLARPETGSFPQEDGSTITRAVEDIVDESGKVIGMKITSVQTNADGKEISRSETTQTVIENPIPEAKPSTTYTLPEKPESSTKTEDGITTTVTVTDILNEDGKVIGYKSTTVQTDANGAELYREEHNLYGTEETIEETVTSGNNQSHGSATVKVTTVETSRVTAEETTFTDIETYTRLNQIVNNMTVETQNELVMIDGKLYYIYSGSVNVTEGQDHGDISLMNPITPMDSLFNQSDKNDLAWGNLGLPGVSSQAPENGFKYIGSGVDTSLTINKGNSSSDVNQFRLVSSDNKIYYAMCIDFNTYISAGHLYDIVDIREASYLQQSGNLDIEAAEKIRSVALNGYWGTENGVGSMEDVQEFLKTYLQKQEGMSEEEANEVISALTPGQAQAATQAALWMFGNKDQNKVVNTENLVGGKNETDENMVQYLFKALLHTANDSKAELEADEGVEFLDAEDITATSIVVKEKVSSAADEGNTSGKDVYNTDLNFTLGIEPTKIFGDLKVTVYDNQGNEVKTVVLASKDTTIIGLKPDANGMYTIPDIEIAEGVTVNLKLHGTQDLGTGVYIYTSLEGTFNDSQTLVTLASGSRKVDLDIAMKLDVQEPTVTKTTSGETRYGTRTDTQLQTKTDTTQRKSTTTKTAWEKQTIHNEESVLTYTADVTLDKVITKTTEEEKFWNFSWMKTYDPIPADSGEDEPEKPKTSKLKTILDEKIPLAKAPKTGDLSGIWAMISGLSLGGAALLNRKRKEEE